MKYLGDLFRISVFVLIMYLPLAWLTAQQSLQTIHQLRNQVAAENLFKVKSTVEQLLQNDRVLEACQKLKAEFEAKSIATYTLVSNEGSCHELVTTLPPVKMIGVVEAFDIKGSLLNFVREKTRATEWAISVPTPQKINFFTELNTNQVLREALITDLLLVIYIIFAFVFCAVLILAKSIQNQYRKNGQDPLWLKLINSTFGRIQLHDLKIVKAATTILLKKNESLLKDRELLETSLEFSILNEIRENQHNIPYTFHGTVAKVDINGFSKMISNESNSASQNLTKVLEDFGCELLQRYEGLFEKTVGDEIVVVFKNQGFAHEKNQNSAMLATAFSRDLMREFSEAEFNFNNEKRRFTLKSSISSSEITFSKRAPGFGFLGNALTYTTRLLDVVNIKDRNILSCMKNQAEEIRELVLLAGDSKVFEFKNMPASEGYLIEQFLKIEEAYDTKNHLLKFFRSNESLVFLLEKIKVEPNIKKLDLIFSCFTKTHVRVCSPRVITAWIESIQIFEKRVQTNTQLAFNFSQLIIEGARLIPVTQWTDACTSVLVSISRHIEGRINASVVDVLIEKNLNPIAIEFEKTFLIETDQSFRTRGNLVISRALHQLSNSSFDKVIKMIKSSNPLEVRTGIYCACRIILHYQKENPAELETFSLYKKLSGILIKLNAENHKNTSPRLVALLEQVLRYSPDAHPNTHREAN